MSILMKGVWKTYGEGHTAVHALRDVSFEGEQGEFTTILGPSGSGKTTRLNLVGANDEATAEAIEVNGVDLGTLDLDGRVGFRRSGVGFVFQFLGVLGEDGNHRTRPIDE